MPSAILTEKKSRHAAFGYLKGKINVPDDFNEPLEDFKEYMLLIFTQFSK